MTIANATSLFYSVFPYTHKLMNQGRELPSRAKRNLTERRSFTEALRMNGYTTAAFVGDEEYKFENGIENGFKLYLDAAKYRDYGIRAGSGRKHVGATELVDPALQWLDENAQKKFFMFLQVFDMRCPFQSEDEFQKKFTQPYGGKIDFTDCYVTPTAATPQTKNGKQVWPLESWGPQVKNQSKSYDFDEQAVAHLKGLYDAALAQTDARLDRLFKKIEELKLEKNTVVIFLSDNGEYLGESGFFGQASTSADGSLHNENLNFPLMIKHPKVSEKKVLSQIVQTVDIGPTVLELLDVGSSRFKQVDGKTLLSAMAQGKEVNKVAFSGARRRGDNRSVYQVESAQDSKWKLTYEYKTWFEAGQRAKISYKFIDLQADPNELQDVKEKHPEKAQEFLNHLIQFRTQFSEKAEKTEEGGGGRTARNASRSKKRAEKAQSREKRKRNNSMDMGMGAAEDQE